jgi:hypothetical protein
MPPPPHDESDGDGDDDHRRQRRRLPLLLPAHAGHGTEGATNSGAAGRDHLPLPPLRGFFIFILYFILYSGSECPVFPPSAIILIIIII